MYSSKKHYEDLSIFEDKLNYLSASNLKILLFSLSGFSDYVLKTAKAYTLVTLEKMYS